MDKSIQIDTFCRLTRVSRETISSLNEYESLLIYANKNVNLIGKSTLNQIWNRHFLDSSQVIDFIDKNCKSLVDLGSGAGFPGMVLAILAKDREMPIRIKLIEKSPKKTKFLNDVIKKLNLNVEVLNENIFEKRSKLNENIIVARAFKPLKIILELIHIKAVNWEKIFIFLGKTGKKELIEASKNWDIEYKQWVSVTSSNSIILEISKLNKIN